MSNNSTYLVHKIYLELVAKQSINRLFRKLFKKYLSPFLSILPTCMYTNLENLTTETKFQKFRKHRLVQIATLQTIYISLYFKKNIPTFIVQ